MFSLIMAGEPDVFDRWPCMDPELKEGKESFSMSRMLEGTPKQYLQKINTNKTRYLKSTRQATGVVHDRNLYKR